MRMMPLLATTLLILGISGCNGGSSSDSPPLSKDHQEMISAAKSVDTDAAMATCSAATTNNLYFVKASQSFKTCVQNAGSYQYVDVSVERSKYDGITKVLSLAYFSDLPLCTSYSANLVAYVAESKKLIYCGPIDGYRWWRRWQDVDINAQGSACSVATNGQGDKVISCGSNTTTITKPKDGADGIDGQDGAQGATGANGVDGAKGDTGDQGPQGPQGEQGPAGPNGQNGSAGPVGPQGPAGPQGPEGATGPQGPAGPAGLPGNNGGTGPQGPAGPGGAEGIQGDRGPQGPKGETGDTGAAGAKGADGTNGTNGSDAVQTCDFIDNNDGSFTLNCNGTAIRIGKGRNIFTQMASGAFSTTCGLSEKGDVWCWGYNRYGDLGLGLPPSPSTKRSMTKVPGLPKITKLVGGHNHYCGLTEANSAYCWGEGVFRQPAGGGSETSPRLIPEQGNIKDIFANFEHTCLKLLDGTIKCIKVRTGNYPYYAQSYIPITGLGDVQDIAISTANLCSLTTNGKVHCRGLNSSGQMANGQVDSSLYFNGAEVQGLPTIKKIANNPYTYCALDTVGKVHCWGYNSRGQTGQGPGAPNPQTTPSEVINLGTIVDLYGGLELFCARDTNNVTKCWGSNGNGEYGNGNNTGGSSTPSVALQQYYSRPENAGRTVVDMFISLNSNATCILTDDKRNYCWARDSINSLRDVIPTKPLPQGHGQFDIWELDLDVAGF